MGILELLFGSKETNNKKKTKAEIEKENIALSGSNRLQRDGGTSDRRRQMGFMGRSREHGHLTAP